MRVKFVIPVLASILILGTLVSGITPNAYAAQGTITFVNPAEKHGMIEEDGTGDVYQFQIPQGVVPGYIPQEGDQVTFSPGPGQTASDVARALQTFTIFFHDESDVGIPNAQCGIGYFLGGSAFDEFGTTDADGFVEFSIPAAGQLQAGICFDESGGEHHSKTATLGTIDISILDPPCCGGGGF